MPPTPLSSSERDYLRLARSVRVHVTIEEPAASAKRSPNPNLGVSPAHSSSEGGRYVSCFQKQEPLGTDQAKFGQESMTNHTRALFYF